MERKYLEWINRSYRMLVDNQEIPKLSLNVEDGKLTMYRVGDVIRCDIHRTETKRI